MFNNMLMLCAITPCTLDCSGQTPVLVNGDIIGHCAAPARVVAKLRRLRQNHDIPVDTSIIFRHCSIFVYTDGGCCIRPLFVVSQLHRIAALLRGMQWRRATLWPTLLAEGVVEFLDKEEEYCLANNARPWVLEASLGLTTESKTELDCLDPVPLTLSDGRLIRVGGRLDRVDKLTVDGSERYAIWDYKSGSSYGFDLEDPFKQGRKLQPYLYVGMLRHRTARRPGEPGSSQKLSGPGRNSQKQARSCQTQTRSCQKHAQSNLLVF